MTVLFDEYHIASSSPELTLPRRSSLARVIEKNMLNIRSKIDRVVDNLSLLVFWCSVVGMVVFVSVVKARERADKET